MPAPALVGMESGLNVARAKFDLLILRERSPGVSSSFKLEGKKSSSSSSSATADEFPMASVRNAVAGNEPTHALGREPPMRAPFPFVAMSCGSAPAEG